MKAYARKAQFGLANLSGIWIQHLHTVTIDQKMSELLKSVEIRVFGKIDDYPPGISRNTSKST